MHIVIFVVVLLSLCKTTLKTDTPKGPFIFYEGGGAGGIREAPFKNCMTPPQLANFFHMAPP